MEYSIAPMQADDLDPIVELSLAAWAPVFASIEAELDPEVYRAFYPEGWEADQRRSVTEACTAADHSTWVARAADGHVAGFVNTHVHPDRVLGEIHMLAVDPEHQRQGIGRRLTEFALDRLAEAGASIAMVETGGDPGHEPARRTYTEAGMKLFPVARFFRKL